MKVFVVDDSVTIRRTAEAILMRAGHEVATAVDGFSALYGIGQFQPDVISLDILMPRLDGYQTCQFIKSSPSHRKTRVILLSGNDGLFDRALGRIAGADAHLRKPFTAEDLLGAIASTQGGPHAST